jgi:hypothetical protein
MAPPDAFVPEVGDVAALLYARTRTDAGLIGTFNADTRPTGQQVDAFALEGAEDVGSRVGYPIPEELASDVRRLAAKYAAMRVEMALAPEATSDTESAYAQLRAEYEAGLGDLRRAVTPATAVRLA